MKANASYGVLTLFRDLGLHIDASSDFEVQRALRAGYEPQTILLTSQAPSRRLTDVLARGVLFNACSLYQLEGAVLRIRRLADASAGRPRDARSAPRPAAPDRRSRDHRWRRRLLCGDGGDQLQLVSSGSGGHARTGPNTTTPPSAPVARADLGERNPGRVDYCFLMSRADSRASCFTSRFSFRHSARVFSSPALHSALTSRAF